MQPELPLTWEDQPMPQPDLDGQQHFSAEVRLGTPSTTDGRSMSPPRGSTPTALELDTFSSDSADLLRAQLRQVNQRLDKAVRELEALWPELSRKAVEEYKETTSFSFIVSSSVACRSITTIASRLAPDFKSSISC
ncbi:hypothetical protein GW17_00031593 [Ensete ventricosum]|nr:hypothetical protein GW17_00031593 [Ensete ventricosum]